MLSPISISITLTSGPCPFVGAIAHSRKTQAVAIGGKRRRGHLFLTSITCLIGHSSLGFLGPSSTRNTAGGRLGCLAGCTRGVPRDNRQRPAMDSRVDRRTLLVASLVLAAWARAIST